MALGWRDYFKKVKIVLTMKIILINLSTGKRGAFVY